MNTFQLSCFLAVAETLSFARAAEQLSITSRPSRIRSTPWRQN